MGWAYFRHLQQNGLLRIARLIIILSKLRHPGSHVLDYRLYDLETTGSDLSLFYHSDHTTVTLGLIVEYPLSLALLCQSVPADHRDNIYKPNAEPRLEMDLPVCQGSRGSNNDQTGACSWLQSQACGFSS